MNLTSLIGSGAPFVGLTCKAWARFTISGGVCTIKSSFNVTSVTYNGTGDYTINITNAIDGTCPVPQYSINTGNIGDPLTLATLAATANTVRVYILSHANGVATNPVGLYVAYYE